MCGGFSAVRGVGYSHESEAQYAVDAPYHAFRSGPDKIPIFDGLAQPRHPLGRPAKLPHNATMEDEADTPTEQRPLHQTRGTRCGRAVVAGAALLSSGVMLSSRARTTNLVVETEAQPTGDPCYVDGTEDFPEGLQMWPGMQR